MKISTIMMSKLLLAFALIGLFYIAKAQTPCSDLYFSEYVEGSGSNKALEIYNASNQAIDLSNYKVYLFPNGASIPSGGLSGGLQLNGMLAPDSVYVIVHSFATPGLKALADTITGYISFNGNDAITLVNTTFPQDIDVIGVIGQNPGSGGWTGNGVSTKDRTLRRKPLVQQGVPAPLSFDPSVEWNGFPVNDFSNIGMHSSSCHIPCTNDTTNLNNSICAGDSVLFNGNYLSQAGTYYDTLQNMGGCDSLIVYNLTVNPLPNITAVASSGLMCSGDSVLLYATGGVVYVWSNNVNDSSYVSPSTTTTYVVLGEDANGCLGEDSVKVIVQNTVVPTITISTPDSILCEGQGTSFTAAVTNGGMSPTFQWKRNGNNVGTGLQTYNSLANFTNNGDVITCEVTSSSTCGTTVVSNAITLTVIPNDSITVSDSICMGDSFVFGSQTLTTAGTYQETFQNINGCDSIVTLELSVNPLPNVTANASQDTICNGSSVILYGQGANSYLWSNNVQDSVAFVPDSTMEFVVTGVDVNGCENSDTVTVVINDSTGSVSVSVTSMSACIGDTVNAMASVAPANGSIQWYNNGVAVGGDSLTYVFAVNDSTATTVITADYYTTGTCGGTVSSNVVTVTNIQSDSVSINQTICAGDSIMIGNSYESFDSTGVYTFNLMNLGGCDSLVTVNVTVLPSVVTEIADTTCANSPYSFNGQTYSQTGVYYDSLVSANGCDSIIKLNLFVKPVETTTMTEFICTGDSVVFGGFAYYQSGTYSETFQGTNGCDSISTLNLIVGATDTLQVEDIICGGDSVIFGSQVLTQTGVYVETFTASGGCDSIVEMTLEVVQPTSAVVFDTICSNDSIVINGMSITQSGVYNDTLINAGGCDSLVEYHVHVLPSMINTIEQTVCLGDSVLFGGVYYYQAGTYTESLQSENGCDSMVTLELNVQLPFDTLVNEAMCDGNSIVFGSQTITQAGTYTETFQSVLGCDSTVTMVVNVGTATDTMVVDEICSGELYYFGSQVLTSTGTYTEVFTNATGCDSTVTLTLSVKVNPIVSITVVGGDLVCTEGDAYQWLLNGDTIPGATNQTYTPTENGVYTVIMTAFNGCSGSNNYTVQNVSVKEFNGGIVAVSPNPSNGVFTLSASQAVTYVLYNVLGEQVASSSVFSKVHSINATDAENGVYMLKITNREGKTIVKRLLKQ